MLIYLQVSHWVSFLCVDETWELKKEAIEHQNLSMLNNLSFLSMTCSGFLKLS